MAQSDIPRLELESVIGFSGKVHGGMISHPDGVHILYPLGACIVVREVGNPKSSDFLYGHNDAITCLAVSPSGRYIASGQSTHAGFQADVCVFDFEERRLIHRMLLHKEKVQSLAFSPDEAFLASIGGVDDKTVVLWDVETGRPLCGAPAHHTETFTVKFFNNNSLKLMTGGEGSLRVWTVDLDSRKMNPIDINMGNMRRQITSIAIEATDKYAYCGTPSGDVICCQLENANVFKMQGPQQKLTGGVKALILNTTGDVVVGSGSGEVKVLSKINLTVQSEAKVRGGVSSIALVGPHYMVGTCTSNMYFINGGNFRSELRMTCHSEAVNDIVFPAGFSAVFASCSGSDIRVWNALKCSELLRIEIPDRSCNCLQFTRDGSMIVSGWSDGKLRAFGPQSGKLVFSINDAHIPESGKRGRAGSKIGVTSITTSASGEFIITGGSDGLVRVWRLNGSSCTLESSMKEHKAAVNALVVSDDDTECVSASDDGTCIVWDLTRFIRRNILYSQTYFRAVEYYVDESQLLTTGSDKSITYWDSVDCNAIREVPGSTTGELNALSISPDGAFIATGGNDRILKVWDYDTGDCVGVGLAHSLSITKVRVAPDCQKIVSVGEEGAIMIWKTDNISVSGLQ
ncbi:WD domain, G-beta repeat, putative [Angomonas deanei]|uniref:Cilia- and flagella-associated protein 52 n=1 Tax=Angomonas deanei TaxID=59799 RepID=A0A7G2CL20_9TRYP|nr:WD domain, G-beta repeat, putative [Angomonas deanei]